MDTATIAKKGRGDEAETANEALVERMFEAGTHFGYKRGRRHPSVEPYLFGAKNNVEIFNLEKTAALLNNAKAYMESLGREGKVVLFVGGKHEAKKAVVDGAAEISMPYVAGRWIGGTLTNFSEIKKRVDRLIELKTQKERGELESKYTKMERLLIDRDIENLESMFGGLVGMDKPPHALLVIDTKQEHTAVNEAARKNIPVVGLLNSDCDLASVAYPIPANDATQKSISFFVNELVGAYRKGTQTAKNDQ